LVVQQVQPLHRWTGRAIGLDLHRDFCEVAICEDGVVRSAGRVKMAAEGPEALAASLERTDRVAMEVSGGAWEVARISRASRRARGDGFAGRHGDRAGAD
jgi:hypothetical protein